jgi:catechol 2,3-dioxygenase-like lactoylglutathione lyase family enzyme
MALYVGSTVINVADLDRAISFWTAALGYVLRDSDHDPDFAVLTDPQRRWSNVSLQLSLTPKQGRNRVHLDLYTPNQPAEVTRLEGLGAQQIPWEYEPDHDHVVMIDPDGNEFCVIQTDVKQG